MKKGMKKILVLCLTLAMLMGNTLTAFAAVTGDFWATLTFIDADSNETVETKNVKLNGEEGKNVGYDFSEDIPVGYEIDGEYTKSTTTSIQAWFEGPCGTTIYLKKVAETPSGECGDFFATLTFVNTETNATVDTQKVIVNGCVGDVVNYNFEKELPAGYEIDGEYTKSTTAPIQIWSDGFCGTTIYVKPVAETPSGECGDFFATLTFVNAETNATVDTQKVIVNGCVGDVVNYNFEKELPAGYTIDGEYTKSTTAPIQIWSDGFCGTTIYVKPVAAPVSKTVLNITFETVYGEKVGETTASTGAVGGEGEAWTFMLGTDFNLPEGYQLSTSEDYTDQVTNIKVPFGATGGHTMVVEPIPAEVVETVLNITFETVDGEEVGTAKATTTAVGADGEAWTFMLGTDFDLPEGYQLADVDQVTNIQIPFGAIGGHTMIVEKIADNDNTPEVPETPATPEAPVTPEVPTTPEEPKTDVPTTDDVKNETTDNTDKVEKTDKVDDTKKTEDIKKTDDVKKAETTDTTATPKTGDTTNVFVYVLAMAICVAAGLTVICARKRVRR